MPVEDLIHHVNLTGLAGEGSLYQAGDHVAAWFGGLHLHSLFEPVADLDREQIVGHIAHLSAHNNTPVLAQEALASALDWPPERIGVASQTEGTPWISVGMAG